MIKKVILACMALAALAAFALPATASAVNAPTLTEKGVLVPHATQPTIVGTNIGETTFVNTNTNGLIHCTTAIMKGKLIWNTNDEIEGTISSATFAGTGPIHPDTGDKECTGTFGSAGITVSTPLCIWSDGTMADDEFRVEGSDCAGTEAPVTFNILSTTAGECKYKTTNAVKGTYTTNGTQAVLTVTETQSGSGAPKESGGFLCPGSGMLRMSFGLETEDGTPLTIS